MSTQWRKVLLGGSVISLLIAAGCSQASADDSEEAASADWTEEQLAETEEDVEETENGVDDLEEEINSLSSDEPDIPEEPNFPDVSEDYHAFEEIQYLADQEIISGYPEGDFRPSQTISRGQTATMLVSALDLEAPDGYEMEADDVSLENDYYDELAALEAEGIMTGNDGKMMPAAELKRSQMAALLVRAYDLPESGEEHSFTDIDSDFPGFEEINSIADQGITTETGKAFRPNETTSRAQFSQFLSRAMDNYFIEKNEE